MLVAGGAGAVGNAAIQLATWAGASVVTTVSSEAKARLARAAGACMVVNYRTQDAAAEIRRLVPGGVDIVVEVSPSTNVGLDLAVLAPHGLVVVYANNGGDDVVMPVRSQMTRSVTWQFVLLYTMAEAALDNAVASIDRALAAGVIGVGEAKGLPIYHYPLERIADAHRQWSPESPEKCSLTCPHDAATRNRLGTARPIVFIDALDNGGMKK